MRKAGWHGQLPLRLGITSTIADSPHNKQAFRHSMRCNARSEVQVNMGVGTYLIVGASHSPAVIQPAQDHGVLQEAGRL